MKLCVFWKEDVKPALLKMPTVSVELGVEAVR